MVPDMGTLTFNVLQLLYIILRINLKEMSDAMNVIPCVYASAARGHN
jgi:hypothetical protein